MKYVGQEKELLHKHDGCFDTQRVEIGVGIGVEVPNETNCGRVLRGRVPVCEGATHGRNCGLLSVTSRFLASARHVQKMN